MFGDREILISDSITGLADVYRPASRTPAVPLQR